MTDCRAIEINLTMDGARGDSETYPTATIPLKDMESLNNACILR